MDIDFYKIYSTTNEYEKMKIYCEKKKKKSLYKKKKCIQLIQFEK
jgi:hypothetical protein